MSRRPLVLAVIACALALAAGLAAGRWGAYAIVGLVGLVIAGSAFIELRVTLMAIVPVMVLLPEFPLELPLRTEDLLMVPLAGAWLGRLAMGRDRWPETPMNAPLFTVIGIELAATLLGVYRGTAGVTAQLYSASFFFLKTVEVTLLYFIVVSTLRSRRDVRTFAYVLCASAAVLGVWGLVEGGGRAAGEAITGPTGHAGYSLLGLTLVVLLATVLSMILTERRRNMRALLGVAALPIVYSLVFTFSRQSYVGAVAALMVLIWVRDRRLLIPAAVLAALMPFIAPEIVQERALSIITGQPDPVSGLSPYSTRIHALQRRLPEVLGASPLFGFGLAALPPGFLDNQYLLVFYYTGLIGLAAFLWLLWRALGTARRAYAELPGELRGLGLAWLAATAGLALAGLAGSPFVAVRVRQVYWFIAALAVAALRWAARQERERAPRPAVEAAA